MNKALEKKLVEIEPSWFHPESDASLMRFGFACGDGWFFLIRSILLAAKSESHFWKTAQMYSNEHPDDPSYEWVRDHIKKYPTNPFAFPDFEVQQVKEKFRSLRFYYSGGTENFRTLVHTIESISSVFDVETGDLNRESKDYIRKIIDEFNDTP